MARDSKARLTYMPDCCYDVDVCPLHTLPAGQDGGEGVAVPGGFEGGVGQGRELGRAGAGVRCERGVGLVDTELVRGGCPGAPPLLCLRLAQDLTVHHLN